MRRLLALVSTAALMGSSLAVAAVAAPTPASAAPTSVDCGQAAVPAAQPPGPKPSLRTAGAARGLTIGTELADGDEEANALHQGIAAREFGVVTPGNAMKWTRLRPDPGVYTFCTADRLVANARANNQTVRGHTLVWHLQNPPWLNNGTWTRDQAIELMREHIFTVMGHYRTLFPGVVREWDVVNEAVQTCSGPAACGLRTSESVWHRTIGPDYIDLAFTFARQADPDALLFYNDFAIEGPGPKLDGVLALVDGMRARGVPIDGIGYQFHLSRFGTWTAAQMFTALNAASTRGLKAAVTELDVASVNAATEGASQFALGEQARIFYEALDACLDVATCETFVMWGFTDLHSWRADQKACIYDRAYIEKPAYHAMMNRLLQPDGRRMAEAVVREAENFEEKPVGQSTSGGWRLLSNGTITGDFAVAGSASYKVSVVAKGRLSSGAWPTMSVAVDGVPVGTATVSSTAWSRYEFDAGVLNVGRRRVAVTFTNDDGLPSGRDLDVDKATLAGPVEAEAMYTKTAGSAVAGGWQLPGTGYLENSFAPNIPGTYSVDVVARGEQVGGMWPSVTLRIDGEPVATAEVRSSSWTTITFTVPIANGTHNVALAYQNTGLPAAGRNLYLDRLTIAGAPSL